jgi:hypothetical protein
MPDEFAVIKEDPELSVKAPVPDTTYVPKSIFAPELTIREHPVFSS